MAAPLSEAEIARELAAFEVELPPRALSQLSLYLELLLRWNRRINLTGIREPRAIVRRLFGESLCIARVGELRGSLVDVGSGAGFPGLALKLIAPDLPVTLIEARRKKCAFLKEVARQCSFTGVEVAAERFEDWARKCSERPNIITTRAVFAGSDLLQDIRGVLAPGGRVILLTTPKLASMIQSRNPDWTWCASVFSAIGFDSTILCGTTKY